MYTSKRIENRNSNRDLYVYACVCVKLLSRVRLFATPWTVAHQAPLLMEFSREGYWSGWPFRSPADLLDPGREPRSPAFQADALSSEPPGKPYVYAYNIIIHSSQKIETISVTLER